MTTTTVGAHMFRDRIVELVRVPARELAPNPSNWRIHPDHQRRALEDLLSDVGYAGALSARRIEGQLVLIDGHLRQSLHADQTVPVLVVDLDDREADLLLASLDPLSALATPDTPALEALLERVLTSSAAVEEMLSSLARAAGIPANKPLRDPDEVPEAPEPRTEPGQIWELGAHRLICGDATDPQVLGRLMGTERAQAVWTDPPYGVDYVGKTAEALSIRGDTAEGLDVLLQGAFAAVGSVLAEGAAIYMAHPSGAASISFLQAFIDQGWRMHQVLIWEKDTIVLGHTDYHYRHEPIAFGYAPGGGRRGRGHGGWYGGNTQDSILRYPKPPASREHPTMKPVDLIAQCLRNSSAPEDIVLDPFGGSGSTLIACELLDRRARLVEIDPHYCDVIVTRWEEVTGHSATTSV